MSIHPSLKSSKTKARSVLKRFERFQKALEDGKRKKGDSIFRLPKYNPPKLKRAKIKEETTTTLGKVDIMEEHRLAKERKTKDKKSKKQSKTTIGIR